MKITFTLTKLKSNNSRGKYAIAVIANCVWNDIMDPELSYASDSYKAALAQRIPFANPTDYTIQVNFNVRRLITVYK